MCKVSLIARFPDSPSSLTLAYVCRQSRCVKLTSFLIAVLWWSPDVAAADVIHARLQSLPALAVQNQVNSVLIAMILSGGGGDYG